MVVDVLILNYGTRCSAMEGWIIFNEGGWCIFYDAPNIRARWSRHDGNVVIRGRSLMVVVVVLLFEGGFVVVVEGIIIMC